MAKISDQILTQVELITRIENCWENKSKIVFLFGAGVSAPQEGHIEGIPLANQMISELREKHPIPLNNINSYQEIFQRLIQLYGMDSVNKIIQDFVMRARYDYSLLKSDFAKASQDWFSEKEKDLKNWRIPEGINCLGILASHFPSTFRNITLTTNFDPLLEISLSNHEVPWFVSALDTDGSISKHRGEGMHIVHLHGYWNDSETLHTKVQLKAKRPQLMESLKKLLSNSTLIVCGYSAWDDIFTTAVKSIIKGNVEKVNVLWCLFENDGKILKSKLSDFRRKLGSSPERLSFYRNIEFNRFMVDLTNNLIEKKPADNHKILMQRFIFNRMNSNLYRKINGPWSNSTSSPSFFVGMIDKLDSVIALKIVLFAAEIVLLKVEAPIPHTARKSTKYDKLGDLLKVCISVVSRNVKLDLSIENQIKDGLNYLEVLNKAEPNLVIEFDAIRYSIWSFCTYFKILNFLIWDESGTFKKFIGQSYHCSWRSLHEDDFGLWMQVFVRVIKE